MNIKLTKSDQAKLGINDVELEQLVLAMEMNTDDLGSCREVNKHLIHAFQIINERLAVISGQMKENEEKVEAEKRNAMNRLFIAKHLWDDQKKKMQENKDAKKEWKGEAKDFVLPHDPSKFFDISDLTPVDPTKLTDTAIKTVAENAAYRKVEGDYQELIKYQEIMKNLKDNVIRIGERTHSTIMAYHVEAKLNPS